MRDRYPGPRHRQRSRIAGASKRRSRDCRFLDIDHDRDVDADEYALFASAMTGPESPAFVIAYPITEATILPSVTGINRLR